MIQEVGRLHYHGCLICGGEYSCLHHYFPKSTSTALRYDFDNLIPICRGCHFAHHNGHPEIHNTVNEKMGKEWLDDLTHKKNTLKIKPNEEWYNVIIEILNEMIKANKYEL